MPGVRFRPAVIALVTLVPALVLAKPCALDERFLVGDWQAVGAPGAFEQMAFSVEADRRVFNSWLHERPDVSDAAWSLNHCVLRITPAAQAAPSQEFRVESTRSNRIVLRETGERVGRLYRRLKTAAPA
jgi:hypothetical protein